MSFQFQKVIPVGDVGSLTLAEANGSFTIAIGVQHAVGGGQTQLMAKSSAEIDIPSKQFVDAIIKMLEGKVSSSPLAVAGLEAVRAQLDASL